MLKNQVFRHRDQRGGISAIVCLLVVGMLFNMPILFLAGAVLAQVGYGGSGGGGIYFGDASPPSIGQIAVKVGVEEATISWLTNEPSFSWLSYGLTTDYDKEIKIEEYVSTHSIVLSGLSPETAYQYQLKAKDKSGNIGSYTNKTFTTLALQTAPRGDVNEDSKIDILDFNLLMVNWGEGPVNAAADLNNDGRADIFDFNLLMINWTS